MYSLKDITMNQALVTGFLCLVPVQEQENFEEDPNSNPKMKLVNLFPHFWKIYSMVREENISENLEMMKKS